MRILFKVVLWLCLWPLLLIPKLWRVRYIGKPVAIVWSLVVGFFGLGIAIATQMPPPQQSLPLPTTPATPIVNALLAAKPQQLPAATATLAVNERATAENNATVTSTSVPMSTKTATPAPTAAAFLIATETATATFTAIPSNTPSPLPTDTPTPLPPVANAQVAQVSRIVDGDTIHVLLDGVDQAVRYIGIDTPERGQPGYQAATEANRRLVEGQTVYLAKEISETDRNGRLLRQLYLADGRWVNGELAAQGWAQPVKYPPDILKATELEALTLGAAQAKQGFWSGSSAYDGAMSYALTTQPSSLRKGPGSDFELSGNVAVNTPLTLFGRNEAGDWVQVRLPDRSGGWMSAAELAINVAVASLPVPANVPGVAIATKPPAPPTATATPMPIGPIVRQGANLRAGPGTNYQVIGNATKSQPLEIVGRNSDGTWYKLANDSWIAASLVANPPAELPVASAPPPPTEIPQQVAAAPQPQAITQPAAQPAAPPPAPEGSAKVIIQWVNYDGEVYRVESDEFAVIANVGNASINIGGWSLNAGDNGQNFTFPGYELAPGQSVKVYTDENHAESGGFSFGIGKAIWNNDGDCGYLFDKARNQVSEYCY